MAETIRIKDTENRPPRGEQSPRAKREKHSDSAQDAPSRDRDTGSAGGSIPRSRQSVPNTKAARLDAQIKDSLVNLYGTIGLAIGGVGQTQGNAGLVAAGVNITLHAPDTADVWLELGQQIPAVRRALESMLTGSAIATLAMSHVAMVAPVVAALGLIPGSFAEPFMRDEAKQAGALFAQMQATAHANDNGSSGNS